ncbi:hypothetical protein CDAR_227721 [Caerostris darwini]|uniref:Uncharacterized protein n=1 Tax=Caerostris darwini TaxID=1538125 RepID=A0AAV4WLT7_9ARAC|nr:hypothetical protein CDAR_227721 [Caerostris darwini]
MHTNFNSNPHIGAIPMDSRLNIAVILHIIEYPMMNQNPFPSLTEGEKCLNILFGDLAPKNKKLEQPLETYIHRPRFHDLGAILVITEKDTKSSTFFTRETVFLILRYVLHGHGPFWSSSKGCLCFEAASSDEIYVTLHSME